jgi:hypothetical protein
MPGQLLKIKLTSMPKRYEAIVKERYVTYPFRYHILITTSLHELLQVIP